MSHFLNETLPLFGYGFLGILMMSFIKMNDINQMNDNYTFTVALKKFISREWASYGLSLVIIFTTSLTHDEWMPLFQSGKLPVDQVFSIIGAYVKLSMVLWGLIGQYLIYKWLGKMKTPQATQQLDALAQQKKTNS